MTNQKIITKYITKIFLIFVSLFTLSLINYYIIWFMMEISNFLFTYILYYSMKDKNKIFFYFIIQTLSSTLFMVTITISNMFMIKNPYYSILLISLLIKLSIPPFHIWLPLMAKSLPWDTLIFMLTVQKIIPFYLLSMMIMPKFILYMLIITCAILPPFLILNISNFKLIIAYSSINQSAWMLWLMFLKNMYWLIYLLSYSIILSLMIFMIFTYKINLNDSLILNNNTHLNTLNILIMFSFSGAPPFSFLFLKWYGIFLSILDTTLWFLLIILIFSALIMMFIYMNMMIKYMYLSTPKTKKYKFSYIFNKLILIFIILSLLLFSIIFLMM